MRRNAAIWLLLSVLVIGLDLWTKQIALETLVLHRPVAFIDGVWNWMLTYNEGAAFSFLGDASGWQRWFLSALALAISLGLAVALWRSRRDDWRQALPFSLIIGGALGNLVDRVRYGHVIDFIDWYWRDYHWPAFNLADSAIVCGAIALALFGFGSRAASGR